MTRSYKVLQSRPNKLPPIKHTYEGFDRKFDKETKYVAIVETEGEIEMYALDNMESSINELKRFLDNDEFPYLIIGIFEKVK